MYRYRVESAYEQTGGEVGVDAKVDAHRDVHIDLDICECVIVHLGADVCLCMFVSWRDVFRYVCTCT